MYGNLRSSYKTHKPRKLYEYYNHCGRRGLKGPVDIPCNSLSPAGCNGYGDNAITESTCHLWALNHGGRDAYNKCMDNYIEMKEECHEQCPDAPYTPDTRGPSVGTDIPCNSLSPAGCNGYGENAITESTCHLWAINHGGRDAYNKCMDGYVQMKEDCHEQCPDAPYTPDTRGPSVGTDIPCGSLGPMGCESYGDNAITESTCHLWALNHGGRDAYNKCMDGYAEMKEECYVQCGGGRRGATRSTFDCHCNF